VTPPRRWPGRPTWPTFRWPFRPFIRCSVSTAIGGQSPGRVSRRLLRHSEATGRCSTAPPPWAWNGYRRGDGRLAASIRAFVSSLEVGRRLSCATWTGWREAVIRASEGLPRPSSGARSASGTNPLGLIQHLTWVEEHWYQRVFLGQDPGHVIPDNPMGGLAGMTRAQVVAAYRRRTPAATRSCAPAPICRPWSKIRIRGEESTVSCGGSPPTCLRRRHDMPVTRTFCGADRRGDRPVSPPSSCGLTHWAGPDSS